jgi:hypothetical protein
MGDMHGAVTGRCLDCPLRYLYNLNSFATSQQGL